MPPAVPAFHPWGTSHQIVLAIVSVVLITLLVLARTRFASLAERALGTMLLALYPVGLIVHGLCGSLTAQTMLAASQWIQALVERAGLRDVVLIGPAPCPIDRIKDRWRWHLLLKATRNGVLTRLSRYIAERFDVPQQADLRLVVDRDPVSLL